MAYIDQTIKYYKGSPKLKKAIAAGTLIDNRLKLEYSNSGTTDCHFDMQNYLKYFSYEALSIIPKSI